MDQVTLAILAVLGMGTTGLALRERSNEVVWGALGIVIWGVFGLGATNVEIFAESTTYTRTYGSVAFVAGALVLVNIVITVWGSITLLKPKEDESDIHRGPV